MLVKVSHRASLSKTSSGLAATFFNEEGKSMKPLNAPYSLSLIPYPLSLKPPSPKKPNKKERENAPRAFSLF